MQIERFVEKPNRETAEGYIESGDYYWNSGMFMFRASQFLVELERLAPDILEASKSAYDKAVRDMDFIRLDAEAFGQSPSNSIDYAVMENTEKGVVIPLDAGWNDVGSWSALWEIGGKDEAGNVKIGDVLALESENCYLRSDGRLLATVGIVAEQELIIWS
jgi:mannose-1-phosphate guanylyltransferase/mannose-6-phosphate isomerase